jgi:hypothetical protein
VVEKAPGWLPSPAAAKYVNLSDAKFRIFMGFAKPRGVREVATERRGAGRKEYRRETLDIIASRLRHWAAVGIERDR